MEYSTFKLIWVYYKIKIHLYFYKRRYIKSLLKMSKKAKKSIDKCVSIEQALHHHDVFVRYKQIKEKQFRNYMKRIDLFFHRTELNRYFSVRNIY